MATTDIGRVTPIWRGFYSAATTYELNDLVIDNSGSVWWHKSEDQTTGVAPVAGEIWDAVIDMSEFSGLIQAAITTAQTALAAAQAALADVATDMERAETAAQNAENSATAASESAAGVGALAQAAAASAAAAEASETSASGSATSAAGSAEEAEAWATGGSGGTATATNNAKYYSEQSSASATSAASSASAAQDVLDSIPEDYSQLSEDVSDLKTQLMSEGNVSYSLAGGTGESWSTQEIILDNVVYELIIKAFTVRNSLTSGYVIATVFTYADADDTTGKQILTISKAAYTNEDINIKIDNTISKVYKIKIMLRPENNTTAQVILRNIATSNSVEKNTAITKTAGILVPFFEYGNITFSSSGWGVYTDSTSRIRTPTGMEVDVNGGDVIYCSNSIEAFISCTSDNVKWTTRGWVTGTIIAPLTGKYAFVLRYSPESAITNINDVSSKFVVFSGNMATVFYNTSNFVNIVGLEDSINRSYVNYSTGAEVITGSNIFTRKFINPNFKEIKVFGTSADNVPAVIAFYSDTIAEAGSYMSGVRYDPNSANGAWYSADVPTGCKMVTVTSRRDGNPVIILASADILSNKINQSYYAKPSFMVPSKPYIVKHGGDSVIAPENSLPLFELAGKSGYWGIETDVRMTSDNVLVCMHDSTIDRTTTGTGAVSELTYNELQNYTIDVGDYTEYTEEELKVPTFEEYLRICRRYGCIAIIEVYNIVYGSRLIDTIRKMGMEDSCIIISFTAGMGTSLRQWSKKIPFILLYATGTNLSTADLDNLPLNSGVGVGADANGDIATYTPEFIEYAHITGRYISAWTLGAGKIDKWAYSGADMITVYSKE